MNFNYKQLILWLSDAATMFLNGAVRGLPVGGAVGGAAAASTDSLDPQTLSTNAAVGLLLGMAANGLKAVVVWHDAHPLPNPFRNEENPPSPPASP